MTTCVLVYDNDKHRMLDKTLAVESIELDADRRTYRIKFHSKAKIYTYHSVNVDCFRNPISVDLSQFVIYVRGDMTEDIAELVRFGERIYHIRYRDGSLDSVDSHNLKLIRDFKDDPTHKQHINYLREIAVGIDNLKTDPEDLGFLATELESLPILEGSVLHDYIADIPIKSEDPDSVDVGEILLPFSANSSQLKAIKRALSSNISVIQGPPGTGKTQTILNLIVNLIYRDKTVGMVSGNNEAIRNVQEKLEAAGLPFFGAFLGNRKNIDAFFDVPHPLPRLKDIATEADWRDFRSASATVDRLFRIEEENARLNMRLLEMDAERANFENYLEGRDLPASAELLTTGDDTSISVALNLLKRLTLKPRSALSILIMLCFSPLFRRRRWIARHLTETIDILQSRAYESLCARLAANEEQKKEMRADLSQVRETLARTSRLIFNAKLTSRYRGMVLPEFTADNYLEHFKRFVGRFPLIYSTTNSIRRCSGKNFMYDYLLVDESSQINIATAALAMGMARNIVFVGDPQQLPHVVRSQDRNFLDDTYRKYKKPIYEHFAKSSILTEILEKYGQQVPFTLLNMHYRCDPHIINFNNKLFYRDKLLIARPHRPGNGIRIITHEGHCYFNRTNSREIDIIEREVLPHLADRDVGIIAPFRNQVDRLRATIADQEVTIDTVHRFQGKERSVIILSATSERLRENQGEERTDFLNNPNLINVAISRAQDQLYVVACQKLLEQDGLMRQLKEYVNYYGSAEDPAVRPTAVRSIFDCFYKDGKYEPQVNDGGLIHVSDFASENLIATVLSRMREEADLPSFGFVHNYPLHLLLDSQRYEDLEERRFIDCPFSHIDFLLYRAIGKRPLLAIEVDGKQHRYAKQARRDRFKDGILARAGIPLLRIRTTDVDVEKRLRAAIRLADKNLRG